MPRHDVTHLREGHEIPVDDNNPLPIPGSIVKCSHYTGVYCDKLCAHRKQHIEYGSICCATICTHTGKLVRCLHVKTKG
jgi:hypothetical protein